ncbi:putative lipin [Cyclospora cayetanensis]|uniref:phosphatidate phosphatase n=1 Tax=Cyclospora cayetanensis TaxID=88456 RepID=A0A1D3D7G9_9EIME|nr:putative lipin [Cyclospora cayetanensis]
MWGRIVNSVSNALDFNQATLSGCIDIICVRNPHTGELHSTPFHVRFGKAKLLRSREKIVSVAVNNKATALVMKLGAAGEAYFMQEVEDDIGVTEEELASPLCSPLHSPRRGLAIQSDASLPPVSQDTSSHPPAHPGQGASLSTAATAVLAEPRKATDRATKLCADSGNERVLQSSGTESALHSSGSEGSVLKEAPRASLPPDASSTWRSAWGTAARYEGTTVGVSETTPAASYPDGENRGEGRGDESRAAVQFSLCGHVLFGTADEAQHDADVFKANLVTWEALDENPGLWYHPSLVACFERTPPYYPAKVALPLLASWLLFNRPLSLYSVKKLMTAEITYTDRDGTGWAPWQMDSMGSGAGLLRPRPEPLSSSDFTRSSPHKDQLQGATFSSGVNSDSESPAFASNTEPCSGKRLRRSLRPTPQQLVNQALSTYFLASDGLARKNSLESLDLKPGANSVCFTVRSSLQGEKSVCGTIYLWSTDIKIVVSDVDGTITRSDVLGQLMPIVGRDWSHTGVAELFTKIKRSGYLILYLTARAIGQADATRDYLFGLTQKERDKLPDGPLILSPDRLFPSFRREVIDRKPYIFKIAALRDIRSLFPANRNPFYAGFGNRESDHRAYIHVGIPEAKIFIIDTAGVIHHISNSTYARTYETMSEIAEHMFPPVKNSPIAQGQTTQELEEREEEEVRQRKRLQYTLHVDKQDDNWVSPTAVCCSGCNDEPHQIVL